jgi:hypothetical protein
MATGSGSGEEVYNTVFDDARWPGVPEAIVDELRHFSPDERVGELSAALAARHPSFGLSTAQIKLALLAMGDAGPDPRTKALLIECCADVLSPYAVVVSREDT